MDFLTNAVPQWVSISFLLTIPIPIFMIATTAKQGAIRAAIEPQKVRLIYLSIIVFYTIYLTYTAVMSWLGVFSENTLPPKIILYTTLPLLLFLSLVVSNLKIYKTILQHLTLQELVILHFFRLIGVFFLILNAYGAIPTKFAYIAGIGDIATALTSIWVAKAITSKKSYAKLLTVIWNIFGLLDIFSVIIMAILTTKLSIETGSQSVIEMTKFPICLIPAFAAGTIIFLHFSLFRKLIASK